MKTVSEAMGLRNAVLTGNPLYTVTEGEAIFNGKNLLDMKPEDRARRCTF